MLARPPERAAKSTRIGAAIVAVLIVFVGYYAFPERYLDRLRAGLSDPVVVAASEVAEIDWEPFSHARVEELAADGRTIFID